jgi:hypothetical protein
MKFLLTASLLLALSIPAAAQQAPAIPQPLPPGSIAIPSKQIDELSVLRDKITIARLQLENAVIRLNLRIDELRDELNAPRKKYQINQTLTGFLKATGTVEVIEEGNQQNEED